MQFGKELYFEHNTERASDVDIQARCVRPPPCRGVVMPERGGAPFRQIFLSRNGAPANIVYHKQNADTAAFRQISSGRGRLL